MKEEGMNQRCTTTRVMVDGNWEDYMWPHQIDKTPRLDSEVLSFLDQHNLSKLIEIFQTEEVLSMKVLLLLKEKDLKEMGIKTGDRKVILKEMNKSQKPAADPPFLVVYTSGPAADHQGNMLGLYRKTEDMREGHSVYRQEHDTKYGANPCKLVSDQGVWIIAYNYKRCLRAAMPSVSPTTAKWQYKKDKVWQDDPALTVTCISEKPNVCEVTISLSEDVKKDILEPGVAGLYTADGSYCYGRPVLQQEVGRFTLYVERGCWRVSDDVEGDDWYLMSGSVPSQCPADPRAARDERRRWNHWRYDSNQEMYTESTGIIVKCNKH